jgi:O-antigen/teichoic acid export membrane protein
MKPLESPEVGSPERKADVAETAPASLRANVIFNYASQAWVILAGLAAMPFYLGRLGAEAYGLIGFFTLLNAWFQILDAGLSLTLARECARYRAGAIDAALLRAISGFLERIFYGVAAVGAAIVVAAAPLLARHWLHVQTLPAGEVTTAILLMGLTVPLQWVTGLYRGALNGFERQASLGAFNMAIATLRYGGAAVVLVAGPPSILNFFSYQLGVSIIELAALAWMGHAALPAAAERRRLTRTDVAGLTTFAGGMAFAVITWTLINQVDKLILSKMLPLAVYGVFSLAVIAANGITIVGTPISVAVLPRMVKIMAEGDDDAFERLYRRATEFICLATGPAAVVLALYARPVMMAWTGDATVAAEAAPILTPYALGAAAMALGSFPYYLQYARGDLRLHVIGSLLLLSLMAPAVTLAALRYGAVGAGYAWMSLHLGFFLFWAPVVHARFAPGLHWRWLVGDVAPVLAAAGVAAWAFRVIGPSPVGRIDSALTVLVAAVITGAAAAAATPIVRQWFAALAHRLAAAR